MIKIVETPERLNTFFKQILAYSKNPMTDSAIVRFTNDAAIIESSLARDTLVYARYEKNFFITLEVSDKNELFMATATLVKDRLAYGFKAEKITFQTDKENVVITGSTEDDVVTEKLDEINHEKEAPFKSIMTEVGLLPVNPETDKVMEFNLQALIDPSKFTDLPQYEEVQFDFKDGKLVLHLKDALGTRDRPIPFKTTGTPSDIKASFQFKTIQQLITQFDKEVWISINNRCICLSTKNKDSALTYAFSILEEQ